MVLYVMLDVILAFSRLLFILDVLLGFMLGILLIVNTVIIAV